MLIINESTIRKVISHKEIIVSIEDAFRTYESGNFSMPNRIHINNKENTLLYMPCFTDEIFGTKSLTVFPENNRVNKPIIDGFMTLNDPKTGAPLAIIDGKILTSLRTGAVGAVGCKFLSREDSSTLGIIGAGIQGIYQSIFISKIRPIKKVKVFDLNKEKLKKFEEILKQEVPHLEVKVCNNPDETLVESHIVVTTTTSTTPVLSNNPELLKGKVFIGIGSFKPNMREYPKEVYPLLDRVYTDTSFACEESGDLLYPLENNLITSNQVLTIGSLITRKEIPSGETQFFKSVGMALLDLFVAKAIYDKVKVLKNQENITVF